MVDWKLFYDISLIVLISVAVVILLMLFIGCTAFSPWVMANNGDYLFGGFCLNG